MSSSYGISTELELSFDEAIARVTEVLSAEGFGVLTTIDVQSTLKEKLGEDRRPYTILGACNPQLASRGLDCEEELGLLLPCNVIVYENSAGKMVVSAVDAGRMLDMAKNPDLEGLAGEARIKLVRAIEALG